MKVIRFESGGGLGRRSAAKHELRAHGAELAAEAISARSASICKPVTADRASHGAPAPLNVLSLPPPMRRRRILYWVGAVRTRSPSRCGSRRLPVLPVLMTVRWSWVEPGQRLEANSVDATAASTTVSAVMAAAPAPALRALGFPRARAR